MLHKHDFADRWGTFRVQAGPNNAATAKARTVRQRRLRHWAPVVLVLLAGRGLAVPADTTGAGTRGVAAGAESTQHFGAGFVDRNQVERLLGGVSVHDLEVPAEV